MKVQRSELLEFLRAVHRRLVVVRAVERAGLCAAVACVFATVLAAAMFWRGENALVLAAATLLLGALIGLTWGLARRPRLIDAAITADRQLELADLLATALAVGSDNADPWAQAVVAVAEQRCRRLSPDAVVLRKFGGRAWGGIGLASALVLTMGVLSSIPADSQARGGGAGERASDALLAQPDPAIDGVDRPQSVAATPPPAPTNTDSASSETKGTAEGDSRGARSVTAGAGDGTGSGATASGVRASPDVASTGSGEDTSVGGAVAGGGTAQPGSRAGNDRTPPGAVTGPSTPGSHSPPWQSPSWPADRRAALEAVRSGGVPPNCRDVVREYFRDAPDSTPFR